MWPFQQVHKYPEKGKRKRGIKRKLSMVRPQWWEKTCDKEILDIYIGLDKSCLMEKEWRDEVMDMLYKYKEPFSLRDEMGTFPNIEVEIDVTDWSPFFIKPYHVKEEDKNPDW